MHGCVGDSDRTHREEHHRGVPARRAAEPGVCVVGARRVRDVVREPIDLSRAHGNVVLYSVKSDARARPMTNLADQQRACRVLEERRHLVTRQGRLNINFRSLSSTVANDSLLDDVHRRDTITCMQAGPR